MIRGAVAALDRSTAGAPLLKKSLRYLFPDNWSFLLGEVALYAFVVLVATGVYLVLFFHASALERLNFPSIGVRRTLVNVRRTSTSIFLAPSSGIGRWS